MQGGSLEDSLTQMSEASKKHNQAGKKPKTLKLKRGKAKSAAPKNEGRPEWIVLTQAQVLVEFRNAFPKLAKLRGWGGITAGTDLRAH